MTTADNHLPMKLNPPDMFEFALAQGIPKKEIARVFGSMGVAEIRVPLTDGATRCVRLDTTAAPGRLDVFVFDPRGGTRSQRCLAVLG